jgi:signal transduction histidine kinase
LILPRQRRPERHDAFSSDFHTLSHDLRTPLNHINGFAELLLLGGGLDGTQESYVEAILRASQSLQDTVLAYLEREQAQGADKS